jgi:hypothetical protein
VSSGDSITDGPHLPATDDRNLTAAAPALAVGPAIGGPTASSWREQALTRIAELEDLADAYRDPDEARAILADRIHRHVQTAREAADGTAPKRRGWTRFKALLGGSPLERTASNMDAAEADLLRLAPPDYLEGQLPGLLAHVRSHLEFADPRRQEMEALCDPGRTRALNSTETNAVIAAVRAASSAARREIVQIRSFRNILYTAATLLALIAGGVVVLGIFRPDLIPLCFKPGTAVVCPTNVAGPIAERMPQSNVDRIIRDTAGPWDIPLVALVGVVSAAISAAVALRNLRGTTTPYSLPVALAVLKLPTGALTAILGLLLMRGDFVPGLSALDSPAQIVAWAILFGYAQQLFTRLVDERAHSVLNQVGGQEQPREALTNKTAITRPAPKDLDGHPDSDDDVGQTQGAP